VRRICLALPEAEERKTWGGKPPCTAATPSPRRSGSQRASGSADASRWPRLQARGLPASPLALAGPRV